MPTYNSCRLCTNLFVEELLNIFDTDNNKILTEIEEVTGLMLECMEYLPIGICLICQKDLKISLEFRKRCIDAQQYFQLQGNGSLKMDEQIDNEAISKDVSTHNLLSIEKVCEESSENEATNWYNTKINAFNKNPKKTRTNPSDDRVKLDKTKKFMCDQCGNFFYQLHQLLIHVRRHGVEKPFDCEVCPDKFYTNSELCRHMRSHTGEKPFECKHCHRKFSDYSTQIRHERTHTNERPFKCDECEKSFNSSFILKNHKLIHTGQRPFHCKPCNRSFQIKAHLVTHNKSITHQFALEKLSSIKRDETKSSIV